MGTPTRAMFSRAVHLFGLAVRESGQALDRVGCRMNGKFHFEEKLSRHRQIMNLYDKHPTLAVDSFVAPSAAVIGDVKVADKASVWYNCVLRGDMNYIRVGAYSNIQDQSVLLTAKDNPNGLGAGVKVGDYVTVGQGSMLHACKVESQTMLGMGTVVGEGSVIGENVITAPGTVVPPGTLIPAGEYWAGNPATCVRKIDEDEKSYIQSAAEKVSTRMEKHKEEFLPYGTGYIEVEKLN